MDLPVAVADRHQVAFVAPIEESRPRVVLRVALEEGHQVEPVEVDLEVFGAGLVAFLDFFDDVRLAGGRKERRQHVLVREDFVVDGAWLDDARPPYHAWHAPSALPVGVLFAAERGYAAVWPAQFLGPVV